MSNTSNQEPVVLSCRNLGKTFTQGAYSVQVYRTGFEANDAHTAYLKLGSPKVLSPRQLERLQALTTDHPQTSTVKVPASPPSIAALVSSIAAWISPFSASSTLSPCSSSDFLVECSRLSA